MITASKFAAILPDLSGHDCDHFEDPRALPGFPFSTPGQIASDGLNACSTGYSAEFGLDESELTNDTKKRPTGQTKVGLSLPFDQGLGTHYRFKKSAS
jgi:hypothetical protein